MYNEKKFIFDQVFATLILFNDLCILLYDKFPDYNDPELLDLKELVTKYLNDWS